MCNMDRSGYIEPHVAVNTGPGIPARGVLFRSKTNCQHILFAAEAEVGSQIESKAGVAIRTPAQLVTVQPYDSVRHCAVKSDGEVTALGGVGERERLAI